MRLPLNVGWTVTPPGCALTDWTGLEFTSDTNGVLQGTATVGTQSVTLQNGESSDNPVKFQLTVSNITYSLSADYEPANREKNLPPQLTNGSISGGACGADGTWSATGQTLIIDPK